MVTGDPRLDAFFDDEVGGGGLGGSGFGSGDDGGH